MKLISCYLENFGCFKQKEFYFDGNLTVINEQNGYGKSTLVAFIKAIFYGLEGYRDNYNKEGELPERLHYYPFAGGEFGGNLTFDYDGKVYKIERFFGAKSEKDDTLKVYLNGALTDELGDEIGKTVFGIDKQSFERLAFISSDEIIVKSTSSITLKLNEFLNGTDVDLSLDDAVSKLDATAKKYKKSRKAEDEITKKENELLDVTTKIVNLKTVLSALPEKSERLKAIKSELDGVSKEINSAQELNGKIKDYERYEELLSLGANSNKKAEEIKSLYGGEIPKIAEVKAVSEAIVKEKELSASVNSLSDYEIKEYSSLKEKFEATPISNEQLTNAENDIDLLNKLSASVNYSTAKKLTEREKELDSKFSKNLPSKTLVDDCDGFYGKYRELKTELDNLSHVRDTVLTETKKPTKFYIALSILLVLSFGLIFINFIACLAVALLCIAGMVAVSIYYSSRQKSVNGSVDTASLRLKVSDLENKLGYVLGMYGYSLTDGLTFAYTSFKRDLSDYQAVLTVREEENKNLTNIQLEIDGIVSRLTEFFALYGIQGENFLTSLSLLKNQLSSFTLYQKKLTEIKLSNEKITEKLSEIEGFIEQFKQKYQINSLDLNEIIANVNAFETESKRAEELSIKAEDFKAEKGITEKPSEVLVDTYALTEKFNKINQSYTLLLTELTDDENAVEKLDGYLADKETLELTLKQYKKTHELLSATKDLLLKAEQNLKDRYVKPVKDEFIKYSSLIEKTLGEKVTMSKDFEITFERNGKERSEKHLSSGVKSICALCFRLALIKNMYKDKSPFLLLDDPFVFLDGEHFEKVKSVIETLSKEMQIIYFTCHDSRAIK